LTIRLRCIILYNTYVLYRKRSLKVEHSKVTGRGSFDRHCPVLAFFHWIPERPRNACQEWNTWWREWLDLAQVDWKAKGVDPEKSVLFIDDHQSGYRRSLLELMPQGFSRFIHEDNYPYLKGDNMSYKWTCELERKSEWPGRVPDNFAREEKDLTWEQHLKQAQYLQKILQTYYEFPPVLSSELSGQTRYDPASTSAPIVTDQAFFQQSGLAALDRDEYNGYTHFNYVELRRDVSEAPPGFSR